ncbi:hypothetical protein XENTR_v10018348 [Xenopus tropicalis]|nr:hypothetical protein XENTR_v10018348 [Xenopus tropicalis]
MPSAYTCHFWGKITMIGRSLWMLLEVAFRSLSVRSVCSGSSEKIPIYLFHCCSNTDFLYVTASRILWRRQLQDNCCLTREAPRPRAIRMLMCGLVRLLHKACINAIPGSCILQEEQNDLDK